MLKHVWRNRYIDRELFARQGRLLRNPIAEINIIGKIFPGGRDWGMLKHVWRNRYIDRELFARQGRLLRNPIAEINIIGKIFPGGRNVRKFWSRLNN